MTTQREVARLRLAAQWLAGPGAGLPGRSRPPPGRRAGPGLPGRDHLRRPAHGGPPRGKDVEAALDDGEIVRSWPMRGTLHLLAAEDLHWMLELLGPASLPAPPAGGRSSG